MKNRTRFAGFTSLHRGFNRGLSLVECALAVLIAGTAILTVLEITTNTIKTARESSDARLGSLLASEIMTVEAASLYELSDNPYEEGETISEGEQEVDTERFGEMYKGFRYNVTKVFEEIDIETELSDDSEDDDPYNYDDDEEEEELPTVKVVRIKVEVIYPQIKADVDPKKITLETYVKPNTVSSTDGDSGE